MGAVDTVSFYVIVPNNQYFAIGFGSSMFGADMVMWQANGNSSKAVDLYSTGESTPSTDA